MEESAIFIMEYCDTESYVIAAFSSNTESKAGPVGIVLPSAFSCHPVFSRYVHAEENRRIGTRV